MRVDIGGCRLFFDVEGAKFRPDGPRMREVPSVLLLHGGPGADHSSFKPAYSQLAEIARVVYFDHRGDGRSDGRNETEGWRLSQWGDDVKALCDALEIERPIVMGVSFGGYVAMSYALRHPDHPAKLILCSTATSPSKKALQVEVFARLGVVEAGAAARAFLEDPSPVATREFRRLCGPLYRRTPNEPETNARTIWNHRLLRCRPTWSASNDSPPRATASSPISRSDFSRCSAPSLPHEWPRLSECESVFTYMNAPKISRDNQAIALWVEAQAYRMVIAGLQQREIARVITDMGRGLQAGRLEGVEYPPDYSVSQAGVMKAFRRYCYRNPPPGLAEMRRIDTQRCEDMYRALLPTIARGGREGAMATDAATRALAHKARINGMDAPIKVAAVDSRGRDLIQIPIETVHRIMEGGEVVFDAEPQKMIEGKDE